MKIILLSFLILLLITSGCVENNSKQIKQLEASATQLQTELDNLTNENKNIEEERVDVEKRLLILTEINSAKASWEYGDNYRDEGDEYNITADGNFDRMEYNKNLELYEVADEKYNQSIIEYEKSRLKWELLQEKDTIPLYEKMIETGLETTICTIEKMESIKKYNFHHKTGLEYYTIRDWKEGNVELGLGRRELENFYKISDRCYNLRKNYNKLFE